MKNILKITFFLILLRIISSSLLNYLTGLNNIYLLKYYKDNNMIFILGFILKNVTYLLYSLIVFKLSRFDTKKENLQIFIVNITLFIFIDILLKYVFRYSLYKILVNYDMFFIILSGFSFLKYIFKKKEI